MNLMFFENLRINFFKISWLDCEQYGKNHYKKKMQSILLRVQSVKITFILLDVTGPLLIPLIFLYLSCREKANDSTEFSRKSRRITTR